MLGPDGPVSENFEEDFKLSFHYSFLNGSIEELIKSVIDSALVVKPTISEMALG